MKTKKTDCPKCKSKNVLPFLYGYLTPEAQKETNKKFISGGCVISENNPSWGCKDCNHQWK